VRQRLSVRTLNEEGRDVDNQLTTTIDQAAKLAKESCLKRNKATCLLGPPGIGKSDVGRQLHAAWCEEQGLNPWYFDSGDKPQPNDFGWLLTIWSQHDITDLKFPAVMGDRMVFHYSTELPLQGNEDKFPQSGLWNMGEITNVEPYMQKALMQILLERRLGARPLLKGWRVLADGNRAADKSYTVPMAPPLANRILWMHVVPDLESWVKWALSNDVDPRLIAFLRFRPNLLHNFDAALYSAGELAFPSPRQWTACNDIVTCEPETRVPLMAGLVGQAAGMEFEGFVRVWENLPDLDAIEQTGKGKVPKDQATLLAVVSALVTRATDDNLANLLTYNSSLPGEHQMLFAKDLVIKNPLFVTHEEYNKWAAGSSKNLL
jgi:hypothetical protein